MSILKTALPCATPGHQAVAELEKKGYNPEVVDLISLKPFDMEQIAKSVKKTNKVHFHAILSLLSVPLLYLVFLDFTTSLVILEPNQ